MRFLIAGIFVLVFYNGFLIWFLAAPRAAAFQLSRAQQKEALDLKTYFAQKGKSAAKKNEFAALLTQPSVLGEISSAHTVEPHPGPQSSGFTQDKPATYPPKADQPWADYSPLTIAVLGDSMVDTLGPDLPDLQNEIAKRFPQIKFTVLNYGVGAENIESGLNRLTNDYTYLGRYKPALLSQNPDIVVIESFAYNHWENNLSDLNRHWLNIARIIETIKFQKPDTKIVLAAAIAPFCPTYTDGSANLPPERKFAECETVKAYLQNMVNFATSQNYPLADAYHASLTGSEGNPKYINQDDHIHPSGTGKELFSRKVADKIAAFIRN